MQMVKIEPRRARRNTVPPQLHNPWRRIVILDKCITAKTIPINESSTFNGASTGVKKAEKNSKIKKSETSHFGLQNAECGLQN